MPKNTTITVTNFFGVESADFFNKIAINPDLSQTPIPMIATRTVPSGANPVKFLTICVKI